MRLLRIVRALIVCYVVGCLAGAIFLGELAFGPQRLHVATRADAEEKAWRFGATLQNASIKAGDNTELRGWFAKPSHANGDAVILLHGVGDNRRGVLGYGELFLSKGFAVLAPDSRAQGESGGEFPTYGVKERGDVHSWIDWLVAEMHPACVYGMGESMGAAILLQSVEGENRYCAVVAESSFASFRQIAYVRVGQFLHAGPWLGRFALIPAVEMAFLYGKVTRGVNLTDASPEDSVAASHVPILLIHGTSDDNIPFKQSEEIRNRNPDDIALWEVPGAGHCGAVDAAPQEFNSRVVAWFLDHKR